VPESASVIQIVCYLPSLATLDTRIVKAFRILTELTMLNNLQSVAKENRNQLLDFHETDPAQYISDDQGIERQPKQEQVHESYPKTALKYSRITQWI